jgi:hypothetical protein
MGNGGAPEEIVRRTETALGILTCPLRRENPFDLWAPLEIAKFEACISVYGKDFHAIQRVVKTKSTRQVIEFYYIWKKSSHYAAWKTHYQRV